MIEISFGKLLLLAVIALLVLGPEKLPGAARTAGALLRRARNTWDSVRSEVERELEIEEIKRTARDAAARAEAAQAEVREAAGQVREAVAIDVPGQPRAAADGHADAEDEAALFDADPLAAGEDTDEAGPAVVDTRTGDLFAEAAGPAPSVREASRDDT